MTNTPIRISISNPSSQDARDDGTVIIEMEDVISGETLGRVEMPAGRFHRLQLGTTMTFEGFHSSHLERTGKKLMVDSLAVPREVTSYEVGADAKAKATEWAEENKPAIWEEYSVRSTNQGWKVIGYWWKTLSPEEIAVWREDVRIYY